MPLVDGDTCCEPVGEQLGGVVDIVDSADEECIEEDILICNNIWNFYFLNWTFKYLILENMLDNVSLLHIR